MTKWCVMVVLVLEGSGNVKRMVMEDEVELLQRVICGTAGTEGAKAAARHNNGTCISMLYHHSFCHDNPAL